MATLRRLEGGLSSGNVGKIALVVAVVFAISFLNSSCFTVDAEEEAVVLRFGRYSRTVKSGLHFKLPLGWEQAERVKIGNKKQEFGFRTVRAGDRTEYSAADFGREALMLTGDLNQAEVEWIVQYEIKDARDYLFNVRDPDNTLRALSESAVRAVIGDRSITEALTLGKAEIESEAKRTLQEALDLYRAGIRILLVNLQNVLPPDPVKPAFNAVNDAEQERETLINEALKSYNTSIPSAQGEAARVVQIAEGYKLDRVNRARGEAERFSKVLTEYTRAPEVTRKRLYLEAMTEVLPSASQRIIVDPALKGLVPLLPLDTSSKGGGK